MIKVLKPVTTLLVVALSLLMVACTAIPEGSKDNRLHVSTIPLEKTNASNSITLSSKVQAVSDISTPFRLSDYVKKVNFAEGDTVKKGDIVVELQSKAQQSALDQAKITFDNAKKDYNRAKRLHKSGTYSDSQLEKSSGDLKAAEAQYENAKSMASYSRLPSPISGTVNRIPVKAGAYANAGDLAFQVVDMGELEAELWVPEKSINTIAVGSNATVIRSNDPKAMPYKGVVSSVSLTPDPDTNTYRVLVTVDATHKGSSESFIPKSEMLRPGNIITATIMTHTYEDIYAIPLTSIVLKGDTKSIYTTKDGEVKKITPDVLDTINDVAVIGNAIPEGYRLIVQGQRYIVDSTEVRDVSIEQVDDTESAGTDADTDSNGEGNKTKDKS